jgi:hypothetical protein
VPPAAGSTLFDDAAFGEQAADPAVLTSDPFDEGSGPVKPTGQPTVKSGQAVPADDLFGGAHHPEIDNLFGDEEATAGADRGTLSPPKEAPR